MTREIFQDILTSIEYSDHQIAVLAEDLEVDNYGVIVENNLLSITIDTGLGVIELSIPANMKIGKGSQYEVKEIKKLLKSKHCWELILEEGETYLVDGAEYVYVDIMSFTPDTDFLTQLTNNEQEIFLSLLVGKFPD